MTGFIVLQRKILDWGWYSDPVTKVVFLHFILKANYKKTVFRGVPINRGALVVGRNALAEDLGLSVQQIRTSMDKLKSTNEITSQSTNRFTVVTVENYDLYQDKNSVPTSQTTSQSTNEQQTNNKRITTSKQGNKGTKEQKKEIVVSDEIDPVDRAVQIWNIFAYDNGFSGVQKITKPRRTKCKARLKDCGGLDGWKAALDLIKKSKFLMGDNDRNWKASFDFLMIEARFTKLMEGGYSDNGGGGNGSAGGTWDEAYRDLEQKGFFE